MNITQQVQNLLDANDIRVTGRVGSDAYFAGECDECTALGVVHIETVIPVGIGVVREDGTYCLHCAIEHIVELTWLGNTDDITVTVPASLIDAINPLAA